MVRVRSIEGVCLALFLAACGPPPAPAAPGPAAPGPPASAEAPPAPKPPSVPELAGQSLATIPQPDLRMAFNLGGWRVVMGTNVWFVDGAFEAHFFQVENGGKKGWVALARPTPKPERSTHPGVNARSLIDGPAAANHAQHGMKGKNVATIAGDAGDVILAMAIEDAPEAEARAALSAVMAGAKR